MLPMMFNEQLFVESAWVTGLASLVFSFVMIGMIILLERIIK